MAENVTKLSEKRETTEPSLTRAWHPFESLHREIDRLFDDFGAGFRWPFSRSRFAAEPLFRRELTWAKMPAVDVVESEKAYEITADLLLIEALEASCRGGIDWLPVALGPARRNGVSQPGGIPLPLQR